MDDIVLGKDHASLAAEEDIDTEQLLFTWGHSDLVLQQHSPNLSDTVFSLKIYQGKKSRTLAISGFLVQTVVQNPEAFLSAHKDAIVAALRKLKSADMEMASSRRAHPQNRT